MQQQATEGLAGGHDSGFTCPDCGGHSFSTVLHDDAFEYGAGESPVTLHARIPVHCCDSCDFEFLGREGRRIKHEAVCRHFCLLTPAEIQGIRESHGMSRTAFAEITGFGEATLNRWERGAVIQNRANDRYLRLLASPDILDRLRSTEPRKTVAQPDATPDADKPWRKLQVTDTLLNHQEAFRLPVN